MYQIQIRQNLFKFLPPEVAAGLDAGVDTTLPADLIKLRQKLHLQSGLATTDGYATPGTAVESAVLDHLLQQFFWTNIPTDVLQGSVWTYLAALPAPIAAFPINEQQAFTGQRKH
jgi:hypothetical protein